MLPPTPHPEEVLHRQIDPQVHGQPTALGTMVQKTVWITQYDMDGQKGEYKDAGKE
jgi:hypothetical protein